MRKLFIIFTAILFASCSSNRTTGEKQIPKEIHRFIANQQGKGQYITLDFKKGKSFYYPLMAVWIEDINGEYIQTLYVAKSVATSIFRYGKVEEGHWHPGVRRYPQTLPYWAHKRGIQASDGTYMPDPEHPVPDAYTGATPITSFELAARLDETITTPFRILLEVNQNWDWNEYWTNDKFPGDENYLRSCQPAVVYEALLDPSFAGTTAEMKAIGHSHHSGATGELFEDLSTLTTALEIADSISVRLGK